MNLRELVAKLEIGGKPEFSEVPVRILDASSGHAYDITDIAFEKGEPGLEPTVWVNVEEGEI